MGRLLSCSWIAAPENDGREVDPIGLSSLHDAAATVLLPWITNRTRSAEEYLWALLGLAAGAAQGHADRDIWAYFEGFEKALKLFWYVELGQEGFSGVEAIREAVLASRRDLEFTLLSNQRSNGLLGAYIRSLQRAGLVEVGSLRVSSAGQELLWPESLRWSGDLSRGWQFGFRRFQERLAKPWGRNAKLQLGRKVFGAVEMSDAAAAIRALGQTPRWPRAAVYMASVNKQRIARRGRQLLRFLQTTANAFYEFLEDPEAPIRRPTTAGLTDAGFWRAIWEKGDAGAPFAEFVALVARHPARTKAALTELHHRIWRSRGHEDFWIEPDGRGWRLRPDLRYARPRRQSTEWDLRWDVCWRLIRQTHWRPSDRYPR